MSLAALKKRWPHSLNRGLRVKADRQWNIHSKDLDCEEGLMHEKGKAE